MFLHLQPMKEKNIISCEIKLCLLSLGMEVAMSRYVCVYLSFILKSKLFRISLTNCIFSCNQYISKRKKLLESINLFYTLPL